MCLITRLCGIAICVALAAPPVRTQQGGARVTVTGRVSPVVAVSAAPFHRSAGGEAQVSASNSEVHALSLSLSGAGGGTTHVDIPLRLRSNIGFTLAASCVARGATLSDVAVVEVGGGGKFVHPGAAERVEVPMAFDGRPERPARRPAGEDFSSPTVILRGPPISMRGALDSPDNMIEIVLRVALKARDAREPWHVELHLSAAPRREG